jgi:hypothetical protein
MCGGVLNAALLARTLPHQFADGKMNIETVGLIFGIWLLAGVVFCALWACRHRSPDEYNDAAERVKQSTLQQS